MDYKLTIYPATEPSEIVEIFCDPFAFREGLIFEYKDTRYKILAIKYKAREATFVDGERTYLKFNGEKLDPLKDFVFPEIVVTEIPKL